MADRRADGILGDDHKNPAATWAWLHDIAITSASESADSVLDSVLAKSQVKDDDVTVVLISAT